MKTGTKVWLILAAVFVLAGCILFAAVMANQSWDFTKLSTVTYETNTHEIREAFDSISVTTDTAGVAFLPSADGLCKVECCEEENARHSVSVKDGVLTIELIDNRTFRDHFGINIRSPKLTVYLPHAEYASLLLRSQTGTVEVPKDFLFQNAEITVNTGAVVFHASASESVKIRTTTGDIRVEGISAGSLELSVTTGRVTASNITCEGDVTVHVTTGKAALTSLTCENIHSEGSTGDLTLDRVLATGKLSVERDTGDVKFESCDATELYVHTDTGDITGSLLSDKVFIADTDTGKVDVPKTASGGRCELISDTGDIRITVN